MASSLVTAVPTMSPLPILTPPALPEVDTYDYGPMTQASMWVLAAGSGILLWMRLYCKVMKHLVWWDDYLLGFAWVLLLVDVALVNEQVVRGFGRPYTDQDPEQLAGTIKLGLVAATLAIASTGISKTSFALTMLRLTTGRMRKVIWFIIVSINLFMGMTGLFVWIQCIPLQKNWDLNVPGACWESNVNVVYARFASSWSGTMDIVLALLPWKIIWNLKMGKKEKLGVAVAMSLGVFAGVTAYVKVRMIVNTRDPNFSSFGHSLTIWASAEPAATIAAASIPILRVLFIKDKGKVTTTWTTRTERSTQKSERSKTTERPVSTGHEMVFWRSDDEEKGILKDMG